MFLRILTTFCLTVTMLTATAQQRHGDGIDDVLQYTPYATVFILKAAGVDSRHEWPQLAATAAASWVASAGVAYVLKHSIKEWRPDHSDQRSFPSGHATFAFAGATALHKEFGHLSPWVSVGGYTVAVLTAADRVRRDRHHWYDVCAGATIGFAVTEAAYMISEKVFPKKDVGVAFTGNSLSLAYRW
ncbi:MAG: phosphatase PAP2 family protein [Prevotella sp.]|nr:phosphatase PAP2 family protein [Prevotella sp.]